MTDLADSWREHRERRRSAVTKCGDCGTKVMLRLTTRCRLCLVELCPICSQPNAHECKPKSPGARP